MYQINLGNNVLYYPSSDSACIYDTKLTEDIGQAGEFSFKVPPQNPLYSQLTQGELVTIFRDGIEFWRGEIREIKTDFAKIANVYCLEDLAWLGDEFLTPAQITNETFAQRFQAAIDAYNLNRSSDRQFTAGYITNVSSSDLCNWTTEYDMSILDSLRECICNASSDNGHIRVRRVTSGGTVTRYIDIVKLSDYGIQATQPIEYGYNLLDYVKNSDYENLVNVLTPYGDELDSEVYDGYNQRLAGTTISENTSISVYGRHAKAVIFDGVDNLSDLNTLAASYLTRYSQPQLTMEVKAVDLAGIESVDAISIGDSVRIIAKPFAVDQWLYLTSITRDIQNIDKNSITLSGNVIRGRTLTSQTLGTSDAVKNLPSKSSILDAAFKNVLALINGIDGGYVTFETNADDQITEIRIANNLDFEQATKAWRWNLGGLAYMQRDNTSDPWTASVAMTMDGEVDANFITVGNLNCDRLNGGTINGQTINGGTITGATISGGTITSPGVNSGTSTVISGGSVDINSDGYNFLKISGGGESVTFGPLISVNGDIYYQARPTYFGWALKDAHDAHSSDRKRKKKIKPIPKQRSKEIILNAKPKYFEFKKDIEGGIRSGFIAQELRESLDKIKDHSAIERESIRRKGEREINYQDFIAHLVNTVQDLYEEIDKLKGEKNG